MISIFLFILWIINNIHPIECNIIEKYQRLPTTVFSPGGRLFKVEQLAKSTSDINDISSPLSIALRCRDFVLILSTRMKSNSIHDTNYNPIDFNTSTIMNVTENFYAPLLCHHIKLPSFDIYKPTSPIVLLGKNILALAGGNPIDTTLLLRRIQETAISMKRASNMDLNTKISTNVLARRLADMSQMATQTMGGKYGRILKSSALIIGNDHSCSSIWRVEPTGQFWNCDVAAVGRGANIAEQLILKRIQNNDDDILISNENVKEYLNSLDHNRALKLALDVLLETLDFKHSSTNHYYPFENKNDFETYMKVRDLQCMILTSDSTFSESKIHSLNSLQYLHNWDIWERFKQIENQ